MKRLVIIILTLLILGLLGLYIFDQYWIHRYDSLIAREAATHHVDPDLVWSIVYEETYFSPWKKGRNGEIGLMQVTPAVAREWAAESATAPLEQRSAIDPVALLSSPERNVQIGCWYLEKAGDDYRDTPGREARMLAAYNAGPSRAADWNRVPTGARALNEEEFIARIDIASTRAYVTSILGRYHRVKSARSGDRAALLDMLEGEGLRLDDFSIKDLAGGNHELRFAVVTSLAENSRLMSLLPKIGTEVQGSTNPGSD